MAFVTIEDRVDRLEALFGQFLTEMAVINHRAEERNRVAEERNLAAEDRNRAAEDRNRAAEERNRAAEERNRVAEERMGRFEAEMREFREESRAERREMNRRWGDLANKLGTIIEDILAPNLRRLAADHFRFAIIEEFAIRRSRRPPGRPGVETEFDTLVVRPDAVILGEAKTTPTLQHVEAFEAKVETFFDYFPEYVGRRLIPVLGSWVISDSVVDALTARRIYAKRMGEETMVLANAAALETGREG